MTKLNDLATQIASDAKATDDAFAALNQADEARAARLKQQIDALKASGTVDQGILDGLAAVHDSLTGTSGKMIAAAALANTDAEGDVPADVAATVPATPAA
jgi:hypothetical protein